MSASRTRRRSSPAGSSRTDPCRPISRRDVDAAVHYPRADPGRCVDGRRVLWRRVRHLDAGGRRRRRRGRVPGRPPATCTPAPSVRTGAPRTSSRSAPTWSRSAPSTATPLTPLDPPTVAAPDGSGPRHLALTRDGAPPLRDDRVLRRGAALRPRRRRHPHPGRAGRRLHARPRPAAQPVRRRPDRGAPDLGRRPAPVGRRTDLLGVGAHRIHPRHCSDRRRRHAARRHRVHSDRAAAARVRRLPRRPLPAVCGRKVHDRLAFRDPAGRRADLASRPRPVGGANWIRFLSAEPAADDRSTRANHWRLDPARAGHRLAEFAAEAEDLGFDTLWLAEDCFLNGGFSQAATVLAATTRITVGLGILPAAARHPAFAAMEVATLARLHPGRLVVGLGHGMPNWMRQLDLWPASPLTMLEETFVAMRALLNGERVTMDGRYVRLHDVRLGNPPEVQPLLDGRRARTPVAAAGRPVQRRHHPGRAGRPGVPGLGPARDRHPVHR